MSLPIEPTITKFFTNKIASSLDNWHDYLIKIARLYYKFDGQEYDRDALVQAFLPMSQRDKKESRDPANIRDKYGAYARYLGIFHFEKKNGVWTIVVSDAAKQFLCTENPNAAAFCRAQLSLFQYPNGAGASINAAGNITVKDNIKQDTMRELANNIHLNPFRLICRIIITLREYLGKKYKDLYIPFETLFLIFNDDRINNTYNPNYDLITTVWNEFTSPNFINPMNIDDNTINNFKRNFHILEQTGLFLKDSLLGLSISQVQPDVAYSCIKVIAKMTDSFTSFDDQFNHPDEDYVKEIITGPSWGQYYDAAHLPLEILEKLGAEVDNAPIKTRFFSQSKNTNTCFNVKRTPRANDLHPLNIIIYGAPGTGKTYSTAEYALAIIENRAVDERLKNNDERKTVIDTYNGYVRKGQLVFTTFHQNYGYEEFIQGLRPDPNSDTFAFLTVDGVFKTIADIALHDHDNNYVIIIDEINRANISKVFGELITLLEEDKRWGEVNQASVTLQSGEIFTVPNNLYIIGTMNSADKSISLIDAALRRRFRFIEKYPQANLVKDNTLKTVLNNLNKHLVGSLQSSDLLIGHSYFMNKTADDICTIMNDNVIPLLYEYYYDDKKKVKDCLDKTIRGLKVTSVDEEIRRIYIKKAD